MQRQHGTIAVPSSAFSQFLYIYIYVHKYIERNEKFENFWSLLRCIENEVEGIGLVSKYLADKCLFREQRHRLMRFAGVDLWFCPKYLSN